MKESKVGSWIWIGAFILSCLRATIFWDLFVKGFHITALPWIEIGLWFVLAALAFRSLRSVKAVAEFISLWKRNWYLVAFILVALVSTSWSIAPAVTAYRSLTVLFSSLLGAYLGYRYSLAGLVEILHRFGAVLLVICFAFAVALPDVGTMIWPPYDGAWRGIFWHRNHLGSMTALFSVVFLLSALEKADRRLWQRFALDAVLCLLSLTIVFFSHSAAGLIVFLVLIFSASLAYVWVKLQARLRPIHYYSALGLGAVAAFVILTNLDFVFGLFNRNATLTGRVPMWIYLLREVIGRNPWIGYGFGAIWSFDSFRIGTQQLFGWGYPIVIADNGFLDILLHVGLLGFIPFLGVLILAFIRSFQLALRERAIYGFLPLLIMLFAVFANVTFSLFLETESFVWLIIIAMLFAATPQFQQDAWLPTS